MKKEIVYTDKYALILSDEIPTKVYYDTYIHQLKHTGDAEYGESSIAKTVIGHLPLSDAPILEGVPLLPPLPLVLQKFPHFECEMDYDCCGRYVDCKGCDATAEMINLRIKTTTNSQGQVEFVGKYLTKN